jgi:Alkaline phosphatase PhoX
LSRRLTRPASAFAGLAVLVLVVFAAAGAAAPPNNFQLTNVATANTKSDGFAPAPKLSKELGEVVVAQGSTELENPSSLTSYYGYDNDVVNSAGEPQMLPTPTSPTTEAHKTEPDKNVYLVFNPGLKGPDNNYDYGRHFLFQGHEGGANGAGYITRINLDADAAHRVTLYPTADSNGRPVATIDGVTWDPWAKRLIFTTESNNAPTYSVTATWPSQVDDISGSIGRGGYEGIQNDSAGDLIIDEDVGGPSKTGTVARRPNSFIYRFVPQRRGDLTAGKLQALQVLNDAGDPITFESQAAVMSPDQVALHTYGKSFRTRWVTVHDTATNGTASFDANPLAKAAHATPFKRPENGLFRPGSDFGQYFFDETGDTSAAANAVENDCCGGWGSMFKLTQFDPSAETGRLSLFYRSNESTASPDNVAWLSASQLSFVTDQGDGLHTAANQFDSGFVLDANANYASGAQPPRWLAQGRDASATIDSANNGFGKNDGDNEITGIQVSDGDSGIGGILGAKVPDLWDAGWRWFWT